MSPDGFVLFALVVAALFAAGAVLRSRLRRGDHSERLSRRMVRWNLAALEPPVAFWAVWGLQIESRQLALPLLGFFVVGMGFLLGRLLAPLAGLQADPARRPVFLISASLGNHGFSMGGFLCYLFFGEEGVALTILFVIYFLPWVFLVIFPYARSQAPETGAPRAQSSPEQNAEPGGAASSIGSRRLRWLRGFLSWNYMPLYAAGFAAALSGAGLERPDIAFPLAELMLLSAGVYYLALGLSFDPATLVAGLRPLLVLSLIKFALLPLLVAAILYGLNASGLVQLPEVWTQVAILQASMPAAVYSVAAAVLHRLDAQFAAGLFLGSTAFFLLVGLPALYFALG